MREDREIEKIRNLLKENLVLLAEYHNGDEKRIIAVCHSLDIKYLKSLKDVEFPPILFTLDEINSAVDIFPVELLNIKKHHKVLAGEDILNSLTIKKEALKNQLRFEFRSKLIHLRQSYIISDRDHLEDIILQAVPNLAPIIGALMYLENVSGKYDSDLIKIMIGLDTKVLNDIYNIRIGKIKLHNKDIYIERLIKVLTDIGNIVEKMDIY